MFSSGPLTSDSDAKYYEVVSYNAEENEFIVNELIVKGDDKKFTVIKNISSDKFIVSDAKGVKYHAIYNQEKRIITLTRNLFLGNLGEIDINEVSNDTSKKIIQDNSRHKGSDQGMFTSTRASTSSDFLGSRKPPYSD